MFPLRRFFSANQGFVGARANNFWHHSKHSFRKPDKFVEIWHLVYFNTGLAGNLGHIKVFLGLWAQWFKENLGTRRLTIMLEGTQLLITRSFTLQMCLNCSSLKLTATRNYCSARVLVSLCHANIRFMLSVGDFLLQIADLSGSACELFNAKTFLQISNLSFYFLLPSFPLNLHFLL